MNSSAILTIVLLVLKVMCAIFGMILKLKCASEA